MRLRPALALATLLLGIGSLPSAHSETNTWVSPELERVGELVGGAHVVEENFRRGENTVRLLAVVFSSRDFALRIVANPDGSALSLEEAVREVGGLAGTNASYFTEDFRPLGLLYIRGRQLQPVQPGSRLLSGILTSGQRGLDLYRPSELRLDGVSEALQAGPFLIDQNRIVAGLNQDKNARRTIVATDGKRQWALLTLSACTLADAAQILHESRLFGGNPIRRALNLDGGGSTGIFVQGLARDWNYPPRSRVANYLVLVPR
jgi:uncharacterized protein YigE (DUF2233 family)